MSKKWSFNSADHQFTYKGKKYQSATAIIQNSIYAIDYGMVDEWYRDRGSKVHRTCYLFDNGTLDETSVDERIRGFLAGWKKFKADFNAKIVLNEETLFSPKLLTGGTLDRVIKIKKNILIDIKTSATINKIYCGIQLAAYKLLLHEVKKKLKIDESWIVQILETGTYRVTDLSDNKYIPMFLGILN